LTYLEYVIDNYSGTCISVDLKHMDLKDLESLTTLNVYMIKQYGTDMSEFPN